MFEYEETDLPEIEFDRTYPLTDGDSVSYYTAGKWTFSDRSDEDADLEEARLGALAWIAWYKFLMSGGLDGE